MHASDKISATQKACCPDGSRTCCGTSWTLPADERSMTAPFGRGNLGFVTPIFALDQSHGQFLGARSGFTFPPFGATRYFPAARYIGYRRVGRNAYPSEPIALLSRPAEEGSELRLLSTRTGTAIRLKRILYISDMTGF